MLRPLARRFATTLLASTGSLGLMGFAAPAAARQEVGAAVHDAERADVIERIAQILEQRYVFPDVATACAEALEQQLAAGAYDGLSDPAAFAAALTEALQELAHDRHLRVRARRPEQATMERENPARAFADRRQYERRRNYGFDRVEVLDGNVGYIEMRMFSGDPNARPTAIAAMRFVENVDALIFDMRRNGGGNPEMVRFMCSYLFDEPTHLNSLYWREGDVTQEFWTEEVPGRKLVGVPVYVLTSPHTFSGAEEFSYNLRTRERATLVGETTGGGANPGGTAPVTPRFEMFVPTGRAINPVTGINWEGTGVEPHVAAPAEDALDTALELARAAAQARREAIDAARDAQWDAYVTAQAQAETLVADDPEAASRALTRGIEAALDAGILGEADVNLIGYGYLGDDRTPLAIAAFTCNVAAFPDSANVYDSLGEACMEAGELARATRQYERSLELDPGNDHARMMLDRIRARQGDG